MDYKLVFPRELKKEIPELISAWNENVSCRQSAMAYEEKASIEKYDVTSTIFEGCIMNLSQIGIGLSVAFLYDKLKLLLSKKGIKKKFKIEEDSSGKNTITFYVIFTENNEDKEDDKDTRN